MDFKPNTSPVKVIKKGGTYFWPYLLLVVLILETFTLV